jgi:hypothetical protein
MTLENEARKNEMIDALQNAIVQVRFVKLNGDERIMTCTLRSDILPIVEEHVPSTRKSKPEGNISVWDVDKKAWRSFLIDRVISAKVIE